MTRFSAWKRASAVFVVCLATAIASSPQVFTTLANFNGANGANPAYISLVQGTDGYLYGTTEYGGVNNKGTLFKIGHGARLETLYSFCALTNCADGANPYAGLIQSTDGDLYGTTFTGGASVIGNGTVFKTTPDGNLTVSYVFTSGGSNPSAGLVQATDGSFYGTTLYGDPADAGTVFRLTPDGTSTVLHNFCFPNENCDDGSQPFAGLVQANDGSLYGTTIVGGLGSNGTIFKITRSGALTTLHSFCDQIACPDGSAPHASLIQATDGNLYGTATGAFGRGFGTVFEITSDGVLTVLYTFCSESNCSDGANPYAPLIQATDGAFYGTTALGGDNSSCNGGCGTVFRITPGGLTTLHRFNSTTGVNPYGGLLQATDGKLYGTTQTGGSNNQGTVFRLAVGLGPFVAFVRSSGRVGQTGGILGQGFIGTTSVSLNGIPASFTVVSDTFIHATVPPGATTGFVTVVTPSGTLTSNVPFRVLQ